MAGVQVFYLLTDEEIGFRKKKSGVFVKYKKKGVRPPFWGFVSAELMPGCLGTSWDHSGPLKNNFKIKTDSTGPWGPRGPSYTETPDIPPLRAADTGTGIYE